jgi:hypothetical protein
MYCTAVFSVMHTSVVLMYVPRYQKSSCHLCVHSVMFCIVYQYCKLHMYIYIYINVNKLCTINVLVSSTVWSLIVDRNTLGYRYDGQRKLVTEGTMSKFTIIALFYSAQNWHNHTRQVQCENTQIQTDSKFTVELGIMMTQQLLCAKLQLHDPRQIFHRNRKECFFYCS